jgi:polysaccharide chain length determinant protein (PEP-CTERM system associated)
MEEIRFHLARFFRRIHWFLIVATAFAALSVTVALTLPPAYESQTRLLVESEQISERLAQSTVTTPASEQLQILEQRLMTRENLLRIANDHRAVRDMDELSPDQIVGAMRAQTSIRSRAGRNAAPLMVLSFEAPTPQATAAVLNAYLSIILEQDVEFRTERAVTTLEFFEQQVEQLGQDLDEKSSQILQFKNENADALPETLEFRMSEQSRLQERAARLENEIAALRRERDQRIRISEATAALEEARRESAPARQRSPAEQRLAQLELQLQETLTIYAETSPQVRRLRGLVARAEEAVAAERAEAEAEAEAEAVVTAAAAEAGEGAGAPSDDPMLDIQLADIDARIEMLEQQQVEIDDQLATLRDTIARTPANAIALDGLERDYANIQAQYNTAVDRLASASTGERIELLSRGQRITVVEPPSVPTEPTKPDRMKLAGAGTAAGILAGLALVYLLEFMNRTPRRPEDIVARFGVMPIASVPYIRSRGQLVLDRAIRLVVILAILVGVPAAVWAVHQYYMPLDLVAEKIGNRLGIRW